MKTETSDMPLIQIFFSLSSIFRLKKFGPK